MWDPADVAVNTTLSFPIHIQCAARSNSSVECGIADKKLALLPVRTSIETMPSRRRAKRLVVRELPE